MPRGWRTRVAPGVTVEQRVVPLDRVGCYVPAGRYPLPSSLLMTAIPADGRRRRRGRRRLPAPGARGDGGGARSRRLAAVPRRRRARRCRAGLRDGHRFPASTRSSGPGNRYVAAAKALVAADCGIDFYAGPTEIVIVASRGPAEWIAADLIAQAEHDPDARAVLITPKPNAGRTAWRRRSLRACPPTVRRAPR